MENYKYVSFLCSNDYMAIINLNNNLKRVNSKYNLVCVVTEDVDDTIIKKLNIHNIECIKVPLIELPLMAKTINELRGLSIWNKVISKIHIFNLTQYDKIVYLDYDIVILRNIDELFTYPHLSAAEDMAWFYSEAQLPTSPFYKWTAFNMGVMVIVPNAEEFRALVDYIPECHKLYPTMILSDQSLVDKFYNWKDKQECRLPLDYNTFAANRSLFYRYGATNPAILHFAGGPPKPHILSEDVLLLYKAYGEYYEMTKNFLEK